MALTDKICTKTGAAITHSSYISQQTQLLLRKSNCSVPFTTPITDWSKLQQNMEGKEKSSCCLNYQYCKLKSCIDWDHKRHNLWSNGLENLKLKTKVHYFITSGSEQQIKLSLGQALWSRTEKCSRATGNHSVLRMAFFQMLTDNPNFIIFIHSMLLKQLQITNKRNYFCITNASLHTESLW